ncbi:probable membrane-associated kinase regulator 6 [Impatiens glandulifera]|uniref:probable membrane-associated kinase regulator 6 n=1 Tax=Impatiens glandulifera TaxID=253017 RepID=UPI001FB09AEE|nr:probable membrane-associated kinase regulator 6 [Impatiens glandulifera]
MEANNNSQQPLSIESFSYSWLLNLKQPSFEGSSSSLRGSLDASDFIEMDPRLPASRRFKIRRSSQDFNFAFPTCSDSPLTLVHADELISGGLLMPLFLNQPQLRMEEDQDQRVEKEKEEQEQVMDSTPSRNAKPAAAKIRCSSLGRCRRMSKQIFWKYFGFFRPFCQKLRNQRSGSRVEAVDPTIQVYSSITSPRESSATYSASDNWRRSCDSESSIYEAVLHCKRSIGSPI